MAKKEFFIGGKKDNKSLENKAASIKDESAYNLRFIKPDLIVTNEKNSLFSHDEIEKLSKSIEDIGLQHNLVVLAQEDGKYRLISGERRYRAILMLLDRRPGYEEFKNGIPCRVHTGLDEVEEEIRLIRSNTDSRELTPAEKRNAILRLLELYKVRKKEGEISSAYSELANDLKMTERQIRKYTSTGRLIPELDDLFQKGEITLKMSEKFAALDEEGQQIIAQIYEEHGSVDESSVSEVKKLKEEKEVLIQQFQAKLQEIKDERDNLAEQIQAQQPAAGDLSQKLEEPGANIEQIVLKKAEAEKKVERLTAQKQQLQDKYDSIKDELAKPRDIDTKRLAEIKNSLKADSSLGKMEQEFDELKKRVSIIKNDPELYQRYQILCDRMNSLCKS